MPTKDIVVYCDDLDDAYSQGYFSGSMTHDELHSIVTRKNEQLKFIYGEHGVGLYDTDKSEYVAPIGKLNPVPKFTLMQKSTNKCLCRSWQNILNTVRRKGYEIKYDY